MGSRLHLGRGAPLAGPGRRAYIGPGQASDGWEVAMAGTAERTSPLIPTGTWTVDPAHSTIGFSVKHMGIANVRGKFTEFEGTLEMQSLLADSRAHGTVKVASIDT